MLFSASKTIMLNRGQTRTSAGQGNPDSIYVGDSVRVGASNRPFLIAQPRLIYDWNYSGASGAAFRFDNQLYRYNFFTATQPDTYEVWYTLTDTITGVHRTSPHKTIVVKPPEIQIVTPADSAKFTFTAEATGVLACTAYAEVYPAHFRDSLEWDITPITGSDLTITPLGDSMIFRFENLPDSNNQFGRKYITTSIVNGSVRDSVMVKAYFPKYATNNPDVAHDWPNWYYYWRQTPAVVVAPQTLGGDSCNINTAGYFWPWPPAGPEHLFHVCPAAADSAFSDCDSTKWYGIDLFAATEKHENQHHIDWWTYWPAPYGYVQALDMDPPTPPDSSYGDLVPDSLEGPGHLFPSLNPLLKDSDNDNQIDFEDFGYDAECSWAKGSADSTDWSKPGHQF